MLCQGQPVQVVGIDRITLIVEPITETPSPSPANPLDMPSAAPTSAAPTFSLTALTASALDPTLGLGAQSVNALVSPSVCPREYVSQ
ncbi:NfeD family protein [Trichothermofontia sichuanensis B231]|uniref:NfeD family protein n=1 Tax=Trichothermofontia sichuanensis TaxID=3045816 RepID=UPI0022450093|nr:NfeD family protein [Trichothermofontia sichuanensis]UZQ53750.1 NfeD family protein [Trichothermofontia sichuanensis B231]